MAYGENAEFALGGAVVVLLRRSAAFRRSFLNWIAGSTGLAIETGQEWTIFGEWPLAGRRGFVDIVLSSPKLEIWIESKTRSRVKPAQLRRFVAESYRVMQGLEGAVSPVQVSDFAVAPKGTPIAVLVISGRDQKLPDDFDVWQDAFPQLGRGYCWAGERGYLRWTDLKPHVQRSVSDMEPFDRRIAQDLITWWRGYSER